MEVKNEKKKTKIFDKHEMKRQQQQAATSIYIRLIIVSNFYNNQLQSRYKCSLLFPSINYEYESNAVLYDNLWQYFIPIDNSNRQIFYKYFLFVTIKQYCCVYFVALWRRINQFYCLKFLFFLTNC